VLCWGNQMAVAAEVRWLTIVTHARWSRSFVKCGRNLEQDQPKPTMIMLAYISSYTYTYVEASAEHRLHRLHRHPASPSAIHELLHPSSACSSARARACGDSPPAAARRQAIHPNHWALTPLAFKADKIQQRCQLISLAFSSHGARATCKLHTHTQQMPVKRPVSRRETSANTSNHRRQTRITHHISRLLPSRL
jgi:hypothetical protein